MDRKVQRQPHAYHVEQALCKSLRAILFGQCIDWNARNPTAAVLYFIFRMLKAEG
jgi:hypothetical protein